MLGTLNKAPLTSSSWLLTSWGPWSVDEIMMTRSVEGDNMILRMYSRSSVMTRGQDLTMASSSEAAMNHPQNRQALIIIFFLVLLCASYFTSRDPNDLSRQLPMTSRPWYKRWLQKMIIFLLLKNLSFANHWDFQSINQPRVSSLTKPLFRRLPKMVFSYPDKRSLLLQNWKNWKQRKDHV